MHQCRGPQRMHRCRTKLLHWSKATLDKLLHRCNKPTLDKLHWS